MQCCIFTGRREDPEIHSELSSEQINQLLLTAKTFSFNWLPPNSQNIGNWKVKTMQSVPITQKKGLRNKDLSDVISILNWT